MQTPLGFQPTTSVYSHPHKIFIAEAAPAMQLGLRGLSEFFADHPQFKLVGQATDGHMAVQMARLSNPDLIIMDMGLPELDGISATQQIKATLPDVRVVLLTPPSTEQAMLAALDSGADAYCIKGEDIEPLLLAIACVQTGATYLDPQIARQIVKTLKPTTTRPVGNEILGQLSRRELAVLTLLAEGKSNPEIAEQLSISLSTVKAHVSNIMNKLSVEDRVQAAVIALRAGLI